MRTIDDSPPHPCPAARRMAAPRRGRAARRASRPSRSPASPRRPPRAPPGRSRAAGTAVPAAASTGVAELLRGPVRPARVLLSVPAAVYLSVPDRARQRRRRRAHRDAARLPLGCVLFRPSNGRPLVAAALRRPGRGRAAAGSSSAT